MAFNESLASISLVADASITKYTGVPGQPGSAVPNSGFQYRFVKVTGKAQCGLATAAADRVVGVLQNKPQVNGQAATVGVWGVSLITAGGAIAAGDLLASDAEGRAVKAANAGEAKGVALSASANAGELVSILLQL